MNYNLLTADRGHSGYWLPPVVLGNRRRPLDIPTLVVRHGGRILSSSLLPHRGTPTVPGRAGERGDRVDEYDPSSKVLRVVGYVSSSSPRPVFVTQRDQP